MYRTLEQNYIDGLNSLPLIPPVAYEKMRFWRFLEFYPDFEQKAKIRRLSSREKQCYSISDCDDYLIETAKKFSEDRRDEIRQMKNSENTNGILISIQKERKTIC